MAYDKTDTDGVRVTLVGAVTNVALAIFKFIAGTTGNSAAMIADAIHSLSDVATDVIVYFSIKISARKPDEEHPYGHGRAETIGAAFIGAAIVLVGVGIAWEILTTVVGGKITVPTYVALIGAAVSIIVKEILYRYTMRAGMKLKSDAIRANAWHHRSDAISSLAALAGIAGALLGYPLMDPLAAVIVGIMIAHVGIKIAWEAVNNLMDTGVSNTELEKIKSIIKENPGVLHFHELKTRKLGKDVLVDLHIQVPPRISISEAHNIAETVRFNLKQKVEEIADALVHIDAEDDQEGRLYNVSREQIEEFVKSAVAETDRLKLSGDMTLHYFLRQICVEITVDVADSFTVVEAREAVKNLTDKILNHPKVTEVWVKSDLGRWEKPTEVAMKGGYDENED
jgi:cation diffusion facilitator family transporter